ncbi:hypothetical protein, partial [Vibrio penaeicida]|uniref:hypothetical protein n=1 Tax=Vibrio penaeicida TaxID=104609 RepID=UPI00163C0FE2
ACSVVVSESVDPDVVAVLVESADSVVVCSVSPEFDSDSVVACSVVVSESVDSDEVCVLVESVDSFSLKILESVSES